MPNESIIHGRRLVDREPTNRTITQEQLLADNSRKETRSGIADWIKKRRAKKIFNVYTCSDSRIEPLFPEKDSNLITTIAAAGHDEYLDFRPHPGKIIAVHWPCGGADAKARGNVDHQTGLGQYIDNEIQTANVVQQALFEAQQATETADEPVLAVVVDTIDGRIIPIARMQKGKPSALADKDISLYDPVHLPSLDYLPRLQADQLGVFKEFLEKCEEKRTEFLDKFHNFSELRKSQNPGVLVIDTEDNPPLAVRYPKLFPDSGNAFRIVVEGDEQFNVTDKTIKIALDQTEYPLGHFNALNTTIIQAPTIVKAREIARQFTQRTMGRDWLAKDGTQMILIGSTDGNIDEMVTITNPQELIVRPVFPPKGTIYPPIA